MLMIAKTDNLGDITDKEIQEEFAAGFSDENDKFMNFGECDLNDKIYIFEVIGHHTTDSGGEYGVSVYTLESGNDCYVFAFYEMQGENHEDELKEIIASIKGEESKEETIAKYTTESKESDASSNEPEESTNDDTGDVENSDTNVTTGMKNALKKAKSYLDTSAFSYEGLIKQLEYEKFTSEEATYGADNCGADWKEQAAKKGKSYLESGSFSRQGLIDQLLYEGFTQEEAEYGVTENGL
ncbi:MAG: Ltp family lipoprotein [Eubacterium sp.]|nr:Ltp family lipoprotein [Eubacterium sp.]